MSIFSCVIGEVEDVIQQVTQQANQIEEVVGGVRNGMGPIQGGAWTGEGANAFIEEVMTRVIPEIMALIASVMGFGGGIGSALSIVQQADNDVFGVVSNVADVFDSIF
jgi:uncharacterized protein YukE